ncbi:hypothetical protein LshimejAT787_1901090 [Lyophyllum shimeji]|uniref:Uncharacterized protein n=1 Tax=Lyophyllum shimeji TaxID=47721 RepID=A0A9P3Q1M9_LYOSH|nr:hypothetical protein LshimejAT787_1901090 [Lyophyllum shimeji]
MASPSLSPSRWCVPWSYSATSSSEKSSCDTQIPSPRPPSGRSATAAACLGRAECRLARAGAYASENHIFPRRHRRREVLIEQHAIESCPTSNLVVNGYAKPYSPSSDGLHSQNPCFYSSQALPPGVHNLRRGRL